MSTRAWSIRTLFPLMAGSIMVSALVTAGGAMVAAQQADDARLAVKTRMDAQILVDQIAFLDQGVQMYNVVAKFVPGQAETAQQVMDADLAGITVAAEKVIALPLNSS